MNNIFTEHELNNKLNIEEEIWPCPFCEGNSVNIVKKNNNKAWVYCSNCEATGPHVAYRESNNLGVKYAIEMWNNSNRKIIKPKYNINEMVHIVYDNSIFFGTVNKCYSYDPIYHIDCLGKYMKAKAYFHTPWKDKFIVDEDKIYKSLNDVLKSNVLI